MGNTRRNNMSEQLNMGYILDPDQIPAELEPFRGRLSDNFFEVRKRIVNFVKEDVIPMQDIYRQQQLEEVRKVQASRQSMPGEDPAYARHEVWAAEPRIIRELRQKAIDRTLQFLSTRGRQAVGAGICTHRR